MNVTQVIEGVYNPSAGTSYSIARLAASLCNVGCQSQIVTLGPPPAQWPYDVPLRVHDDKLFRYARVSMQFARHIRSLAESQDILHGHGVWRFSNAFPYLVPRGSTCRIVFSPRGMLSSWSMNQKRFLKLPYWHLVQKGALRRVDCFHVTSEAEAEDVRRLGFSAPIALVPNGVDLPHTLSGRDSRTILFLGRIASIKGLDLLLPAWKRIAGDFPDWRLDLVGPVDRDYEREFRALLEATRLPRLRMPGPLHGEDKARAFTEAALLVLPSYSENFGMVVAEALAHGIPVITTTGTPWQDIDRNGCGWCVTPDEHAIENAIRAALQLSSNERLEMGRRGRAWIEQDFCWDSIAEQMGSVYEWLLSGGQRPECVRGPG